MDSLTTLSRLKPPPAPALKLIHPFMKSAAKGNALEEAASSYHPPPHPPTPPASLRLQKSVPGSKIASLA